MSIMPTPRDTVWKDGTAQLYRFRPPESVERRGGMPLLLVPSLINRWYVMDLRDGASVAGALNAAGFDTWLVDWGAPEDEDRYLTWDDVLDRLDRMVRRVKRLTGAPKVGLLGYCIGATLSGIYTSLHPENVQALVNLAGPFDFSEGGLLRTLVDTSWFDVEAITAAGNIGAQQMQQGFVTLRPTGQIGKWITWADKWQDPAAREAFDALEAWSSDNIPFPAAAYTTYIRELYQENRLVNGTHHVRGQRVDLGKITCPVLTIATERDNICPPKAARALNDRCGSQDKELIVVPGGHVGAVVGGKASTVLYPAIARWLGRTLCNSNS